ncbi:MAG: hypothetical protein ABH884_00355 [Candidatus Komeilibacteria bacterium]
MKILLFPFYFAELNMRYHSPQLLAYFLSNNIDIVFDRWGGTIITLPSDLQCLVRFSRIIINDWPKLATHCYQLGHLPFYEDQLIDQHGQLQNNLIPTLQKLIIPSDK